MKINMFEHVRPDGVTQVLPSKLSDLNIQVYADIVLKVKRLLAK